MRVGARSTRLLAYAVVGVLGLTQVFLFVQIHSVETGIEHRHSLHGLERQRNEQFGLVAVTGAKSQPQHVAAKEKPDLVFSTMHNLPNGETCKVANSKEEIGTVASLNQPFCIPWQVNSDDWWTHNVSWEVYHEDDTHYCFRRIQNAKIANALKAMYKNQFGNDCSDPVYKKMWNSGLSNDLRNLADGLKYATETVHRPFQVTIMPWHYASPKPFNISTAACSSQDMFCYYLPLSDCPRVPNNETIKKIGFFDRLAVLGPKLFNPPARWYLEYVSRGQTWLRRRVYQFAQKQNVVTPCTALHVRRGDVVAHGTHSRRYFSIAEYLNTTDKVEHNVFLLTDDHNAIGEALHEFPDRNWMYIDRPRYRGSEGGFERHLPSNDPILEMTVLLATFRLVRKCTSMVRGSSAFGEYLWGEIKDAHPVENIWFTRVDGALTIYSADNVASANISKTYDLHEKS